ncbi:RNase P and RNase MRP subunit [Coemansia spiralis]|nr:RNase P and RNase MRP subunit [Coemansia spiralis]
MASSGSSAPEAISARAASVQRRVVFKHALDRPYTTTWPSAAQAVQDEIVELLCAALQPLGAYFRESRRAAKYNRRQRRRRTRGKSEGAVDRKPPADRMTHTPDTRAGAEMLQRVVLGINSTTRALERQAQSAQPAAATDLALVVVCKGDVEPQMVAHMPGLAHSARTAAMAATGAGSSAGGDVLRLVGLGAGAEKRLAAAVGQQCVSAVGIRAGHPALDAIIERARAGIATPAVPWIGRDPRARGLPVAGAAPALSPMAVRELRTTAPIPNNKRRAGGGGVEPDPSAAKKCKNTAPSNPGDGAGKQGAGKQHKLAK